MNSEVRFHVTILTIFPEMFPGPLACSLAGKSLKSGLWSLDLINLRNFGRKKHRNVDDSPYGGGSGLIMRPDVIGPALDLALNNNPDSKVYYPSPRGKLLNQEKSKQVSQENRIIILCGRFEGIDERIIDEYNVEQFSIGDYILSGGEIAAMAMVDSALRFVPGVILNQQTLQNESFERQIDGMQLIEHPLYTKPFEWKNRKVPKELVSGNHEEIKSWKKKESIRVTKLRNDNIWE